MTAVRSTVPRATSEHVLGPGSLAQPRPWRWAPPAAAAPHQGRLAGISEAFGSRCLLGGLSTAIASRSLRRRSRLQWRAPRGAKSLVKTPQETYEALLDKGIGGSRLSVLKTLYASIMGGCYVGMAGLLSLAISGNMGNLSYNMSAQKFVFAALFPVNLLLVLQSGGQLFTGNTATMSIGFCEGKINLRRVLKVLVVSWIGNVIGTGLIALMASYTNLLAGGTSELAIATAMKKCGSSFAVTFVKAIMCNWLVCMAVFLSTQAQDMAGKMVGIWFPISMFVAIGFEHSVANMFLLPAGLLAGGPFTVASLLSKNLIPVTLGNLFAGVVIIGVGFAFSFGRLGSGRLGSFSGWAQLFSHEPQDDEE